MKRKDVYYPKEVFQLCLELAQDEVTAQRPKGRGRPPFYPDKLYIALAIFRRFFNLTLRSTMALFRDLFPEMPCPCFQALHWFLKAKLSLKKLGLVFQKLRERIKPLLPADGPIFILDTTGVAFRGKVQKLSYLRGQAMRKAKGHARLCALIRYLQRERLLFIEGVEVGPGYASDVKLGLNVLENAEDPGPLLGDAGFDSLAMISKARIKGLKPIIRLKGGEIKDKLRGEMKRAFDAALYRLRSIAEGVFGGIKTKMNGPLRCLNGDAARKEALLEALSYNIRVYLSLFLFPLDLILPSIPGIY